jgi:hypothetical protein
VWALHASGAWVVVPTSTARLADGPAVMGAGLARQAATRFPALSARYGRALAAGNARVVITDHRLLLAPTKEHWRDPSAMPLVLDALDAVARWCHAHPGEAVVVPALGCGLGGLAWPPVRAAALDRLAAARVALVPPSDPVR